MLLGREEESARLRAWRVRILLLLTLLASNLVGVAVAVVLVFFVLPGPAVLSREFLVPSVIVVPVYVTMAIIVGTIWVTGAVYRRVRWFLDGRDPTDRERVATLRLPGRVTVIQAFLWLLGAAVVTPAYGVVDPSSIPVVGFTIVFAGMVVCGAAFLLADFGLRPVAAVSYTHLTLPTKRIV